MHTFYMYISGTPLGTLTAAERNGSIVELSVGAGSPGEYRRTGLLELCEKELWEYFRGERRQFDLPLDPAGTMFSRKVWEAIGEIPYGSTAVYSQLAQSIGRPGAARAVGAACGANPIAILIPCHRVLGKMV